MADKDTVVELFAPDEAGPGIEAWVSHKAQMWREHFEAVYRTRFDEYYRIWRGEWSAADRDRQSERSKLVSPGSMQAVEENAAEVEDATFSGQLFDIRDDYEDQEEADIMKLRNLLRDDFVTAKVNTALSECILNAAIYGTGCAEVIVEDHITQKVATRDAGNGQTAYGVEMTNRPLVKLKPILPWNFLVDPNATSVENGMGVVIEEFVGAETIRDGQEKGLYRNVEVGLAGPDEELEPDQEMVTYTDDRVRLTRYYGLVPRSLLDGAQARTEDSDVPVEIVDIEGSNDKSYYVEAIVVLGNGHLLKAVPNPYLMQDRPVVAFAWDIVPGRFYGRGVVEKAYNSQKAVDTELRARADALALTTHPMLAVDATRMPRGSKPQIRPGKMVAVNGNPDEILKPFKFGNLDNVSFAQADALSKMLQQATGAVNAAGMPNAVAGGEVKTGAIAMALGSVMKRHKRTLLQFQSQMLLPFVEKAAWRYMQLDPQRYPIGDYKFHAEGSLGLVAREYEVAQLSQLLSTMPPASPLYPTLVRSIIENMSLSNREEILAALDEAQKPSEAEEQRKQEAHAAEQAIQQATVRAVNAAAESDEAHAAEKRANTNNIPVENQIELAKIAANNRSPDDDGGDKEFERRLKILQEIREDRKLSILERQDPKPAQ